MLNMKKYSLGEYQTAYKINGRQRGYIFEVKYFGETLECNNYYDKAEDATCAAMRTISELENGEHPREASYV